MPVLIDDHGLSQEEKLKLDSENYYEFVDGRLVEKNMGAMADFFLGKLFSVLLNFVLKNKLGIAFTNTPYDCFTGWIPRPDISFISAARLPEDQIPRGRLKLTPDLAIEVISPNDLFYDVNRKVTRYLKGGVKEVWLVDPELKTVGIRRIDGSSVELDENGILKSDDLLPGFSLKVSEIFQ